MKFYAEDVYKNYFYKKNALMIILHTGYPQ